MQICGVVGVGVSPQLITRIIEREKTQWGSSCDVPSINGVKENGVQTTNHRFKMRNVWNDKQKNHEFRE